MAVDLSNINRRKADSTRCMVVGCEKKGLYRASHMAHRGYCSDHKSYATDTASVRIRAADLIRYIGYRK